MYPGGQEWVGRNVRNRMSSLRQILPPIWQYFMITMALMVVEHVLSLSIKVFVEWPISYKRNRVVISRGELNSGEEGGPIHSFLSSI